MPPGEWLTKSEVNARYYNTVASDIVFATEASLGGHPQAVAKLIAARALNAGRRTIRILELGANDCAFARATIMELRRLDAVGAAALERIDYLAVEYARASLEAVAAREESVGAHAVHRPRGGSTPGGVTGPEQPTLVALVATGGAPAANLGLVHAEATRFARANRERFDFVILNELLDDMPCRAYFADAAGRRFEVFPWSREDGGLWTVRIAVEEARGAEPGALPPGTITATSAECVELVTAVADMLTPGGMLLVHDYGFAEPYTSLDKYESAQRPVPPFAVMEFPGAGGAAFPRGFFRVFGNEGRRVVQVTNDVNFAELASALEARGSVATIPHGNQIAIAGGAFAKGQGVFLAEFGLLEPGDDLDLLLGRLHRDQRQLRDDYIGRHMEGRSSVFLDLVYVKH